MRSYWSKNALFNYMFKRKHKTEYEELIGNKVWCYYVESGLVVQQQQLPAASWCRQPQWRQAEPPRLPAGGQTAAAGRSGADSRAHISNPKKRMAPPRRHTHTHTHPDTHAHTQRHNYPLTIGNAKLNSASAPSASCIYYRPPPEFQKEDDVFVRLLVC